MSKKAKKRCIRAILFLVFAGIIVLGILWVRDNTWEKKVLKVEDEIEDSSNTDVLMTNIYQKVKDTLYYIKEREHVLLARHGGKEKEVCQNVSEFFIWKERLYILDSDRSDLFWVSEDGDRHIVMPGVIRAGVINNQLFIVTEEELYYYDCDKQEGTRIADLTESEDGGVTISDTVFVNGYIVRLIPDRGVWVFAVKDRNTYMYEFPFKVETEGFYTTLGIHHGTVFLSIYQDDGSEMGSAFFTRKENEKNGIYKYNLKTGEYSKVSEQSGDDLISIGKDLYVTEKGIFIQKMSKVEFTR